MAPMARVAATAAGKRSRAWSLALLGVGLAGATDVAQFLVVNPGLFGTAPGRAAGSAVGLGVWVGVAACGAAGVAGAESVALRRASLGLAAGAAAGELGLLGIHAAAHVGGWRPAVGGLLGVAALGAAVRAHPGTGRPDDRRTASA